MKVMKHCLSIAAFTLLVLCASCAEKRFERVIPTEIEQYSIVYNEGKYGVYDNVADSLVTALNFDTIVYGKLTSVDDIDVVIWSYEVDGRRGLLSVACETNESMEITF